MLVSYVTVQKAILSEGLTEKSPSLFFYTQDGGVCIFTPEPDPDGNIDTEHLLYCISTWDDPLAERVRSRLAKDLGVLPEDL